MVKHTFAENFLGAHVDASNGIIRGVAVITEGMANGEVVDSTTLQQIMVCAKTYESGLKVKADHRSGIFDVAGYLRDFRIDGKTLRADLYILSTEANRAKLLEMAQTIPDTFGLSVSFSGPQVVTGGQSFARCAEIYSADLVSEPAANPTGLFSKTPVDGAGKGKSMATPTNDDITPGADNAISPAEMLRQCKQMLADGLSAHTANFGKMVADAMAKIPAAQPKGDPDAGFSPAQQAQAMEEMKKTIKELADKVASQATELAKVSEVGTKVTAETVAKEFAKTIGASPAVLTSIADGLRTQDKQGADKFVELAVKHYGAVKNKVKAMQLAINEAPEAYGIFRESGKNIAWPKTA